MKNEVQFSGTEYISLKALAAEFDTPYGNFVRRLSA
jgi:hypothetical protein